MLPSKEYAEILALLQLASARIQPSSDDAERIDRALLIRLLRCQAAVAFRQMTAERKEQRAVRKKSKKF